MLSDPVQVHPIMLNCPLRFYLDYEMLPQQLYFKFLSRDSGI